MKKYLFLFLILLSTIVLGYKPGESLNLTYSNITNVTEPCYRINNTVYISGDAQPGINTCIVSYYDYIVETSSSGGGGGGSRYYLTSKKAVQNQTVTVRIDRGNEIIYKDKIIEKPIEKIVNNTIYIPQNISQAVESVISKPSSFWLIVALVEALLLIILLIVVIIK